MKNRSRILMVILPVLACFALLPQVQATCLDGCNSGLFNVFQGDDALTSDTTGAGNSAFGWRALFANTFGSFNTGLGGGALQANIDGTRNTAVGAGAMESGDGGSDNTAVGELAGVNITGNSNTCLGSNTGTTLTTGEGNIFIGSQVQAAAADEFEFIRIGNDTAFTFPYDTFIAGIYGRPVGPAPLTVLCGSDGKLTA